MVYWLTAMGKGLRVRWSRGSGCSSRYAGFPHNNQATELGGEHSHRGHGMQPAGFYGSTDALEIDIQSGNPRGQSDTLSVTRAMHTGCWRPTGQW